MRLAGFGAAIISTLIAVQAPVQAVAQTAEGAMDQNGPQGLPVVGAPVPGGIDLQPSVTDLARDIHWLDWWLNALSLIICLVVLGLVVAVAVRYNHKRNPNPARFTHNTRLEVAWTLIPILILIMMGSFSLPVLFKQLEIPEPPDLTIKATGYQWYWNHEYVDHQFSFDSYMLPRDELEENGYSQDYFRLATDTAVVVPVNATVRVQATGGDVIHAWAMPSFGVKMDAIPGRLNELWFQADREGVYFGQCSELCGKDHAFMPMTVKVVSQEAYDAWLDWAIEEYGGTRGEADVALAD